jgi:hypothetical protein
MSPCRPRRDVQSHMPVCWMTAFLDFPAETFDCGCAFWQAVTGFTLSPLRGTSDEFATLLPRAGDAYLRVQRAGGGEPGVHLDLHMDNMEAAASQATASGAAVTDMRAGFPVMSSPARLPFCLVSGLHRFERPPSRIWPAGHQSIVDQICLDVSPRAFAAEGDFWAAFTGWERRAGSRPEFDYLVRPVGMPLRILLQRLDDEKPGPCRAHLDLACDDVAAERRRHEILGARAVAEPSGRRCSTRPAWLTALPGATPRRGCCSQSINVRPVPARDLLGFYR